MAFDFSTNGIPVHLYDGSDFIETNLEISGINGLDVTQTSGSFEFDISATSGAIYDNFLLLDGSNGPMTGLFSLAGDPTLSGHPATKQYVDSEITSAVADAVLEVQEDAGSVSDNAGVLNYGNGFTVTSGAGQLVTIVVDESELTNLVHKTGAETIAGDKTFSNNVVIGGDLTVTGTTTTLNTETLLVEDNLITLNSTVTGTPTLDSGFEVERGTSNNAQLFFDESLDRFVVGIDGSFNEDDDVIVIRSELEAVELGLDSDIATLSGLIDTNTTNISNNDADITTLSGLIDTNTTNISNNDADITTLSGLIDTNTTNISNNDADITTLSGLIDTNATNISNNDADITTLSGLITDNDADITTLSGLITDNDADITTLSGLITDNAADITALSGTMDSDFLKLDGSNDPMTGDLDFANGIGIALAGSGTSDAGSAANPFQSVYVDQGYNYSAPSSDYHVANKAYVDSQVSSAAIAIEEDDATVTGSASTINFGLGFDVANDGGGKVTVTLDAEGQFMDLTSAQTASGIKTFADGIILGSLSAPASGTATGTAGDFRWANDFLYICVATDTWKRVAVANF
jgi:hypothetical protein